MIISGDFNRICHRYCGYRRTGFSGSIKTILYKFPCQQRSDSVMDYYPFTLTEAFQPGKNRVLPSFTPDTHILDLIPSFGFNQILPVFYVFITQHYYNGVYRVAVLENIYDTGDDR